MTKPGNKEKVFENRMRRLAMSHGLRLMKSRSHDPGAPDYGCYWLIDVKTNVIVRNCETIADVTAWLETPETKRSRTKKGR